MDKLTVSVFENVFEKEHVAMSHIAIMGKKASGKTELIKQIVGSFLQSGKKILWFESANEKQNMVEKWNGFRIVGKEGLRKETFATHNFISIETAEIDFDLLRTILSEDESQWIIVHDNLDVIALNYDWNEFDTQKLEFLYFVSEFGRVFNLYTLIAGKDIKTLEKVLPAKKILDNAKNLIVLEQEYPALKFLKKQQWLTEEQIEQVKNLSKYEALHLTR